MNGTAQQTTEDIRTALQGSIRYRECVEPETEYNSCTTTRRGAKGLLYLVTVWELTGNQMEKVKSVQHPEGRYRDRYTVIERTQGHRQPKESLRVEWGTLEGWIGSFTIRQGVLELYNHRMKNTGATLQRHEGFIRCFTTRNVWGGSTGVRVASLT